MTASFKLLFSSTLAKRDYRIFLVIMLLVGMSVSFGVPLITLFLTQTLGASDAAAGLFFLTSIAGPPINLFVGRLSDRAKSRAPFVWASAL